MIDSVPVRSGSISEESSFMVLYPGEIEPVLVSFPQGVAVSEVTRYIFCVASDNAFSKLLERWASRPKNVAFTAVNRRQSHSRKNNAFSLVGVTSKSQPGFFVAEHQSITDLVSSQPGFAKKGVLIYSFNLI